MSATTFDKSQAMALKLGDATQVLFCTFDVTNKDGRIIKKPIQRGGKPGVPAVISDEALFTPGDVYGMEAIEHGQYFGLNMNKPLIVEGKGYLVCLDVDLKHKPSGDTTHQAIQRLRCWVAEKNVLTETSLSGVGRHVFLFAKTANNIQRSYPLAQGQEVEIFGLESSDKKSILLTGEAMKGEVVEIDDLETLFIDLGITKERVVPEPKAAAPAGNLDFLNRAPAPAPRAGVEAFKAPLQTAAQQYATDPRATYLKAVEALKYIDDSDYNQWIKVGQALHHEFGEQGRALWMDWSSGGAKYQGEEDIDTHWKSFHQGRGVGIGTLFHLATPNGYKHPEGFSRQSAYSDFSGVTIDNDTGELMPPALTLVSVHDVISDPSPPPEFVWDGYLPRGVVSMLAAHGSSGKSIIGLMLCVATALGKPLFGVATVQCNALFVSLEDSGAIVRHRLAGICRAWFIDPTDLEGKLNIVDGTEHPELFTADTRKGGDITRTYFELKRMVHGLGAGLAVIDNASDAFGGDEIQRRQVRAFIRSLKEIVQPVNAALLLMAHVDKNTSRSGKPENGEGYSGSTAWHNSVRSRLFMTAHADYLTIDHQKLNLGLKREKLTLVWRKGEMMPRLDDGAPGADLDPLLSKLAGRADDERCVKLLKMIHEFASRGQYCGTSTRAQDHAFQILKSDPAFKEMGLKRDDTQRLITQSQRAKWLEVVHYKTNHYKPKDRWELTDTGLLFAGLGAPTTVIDLSENSANDSETPGDGVIQVEVPPAPTNGT